MIELVPDFIKFVLCLVGGSDAGPPRQERFRALNVVANSIHASVIAEGVETSDELATVLSLGVTYG
jgi:EAL domain-containing protein (putative c-di-GMP-specific phosphodiesterase class I)